MTRESIKEQLVDGLNKWKYSMVNISDRYRLYCYINENNGFWNTHIHLGIDDMEKNQLNVIESTCDMCNLEMFQKRIDEIMDKFEEKIQDAVSQRYVVVCYAVHDKKIASSDLFETAKEAERFLMDDAENTYTEEKDNAYDPENVILDLDTDNCAELKHGDFHWTWEIITV